MSNTTECIAVALALDLDNKKIRSRQSKKWLEQRDQFSHTNLIAELRLEPNDWQNYLRMDETTYNHLLCLVTPLIEKQDTQMRKAITPHERLTATLRFLATGRSYEDLKFSACISAPALGKIIPETCKAIYKVLKKDYLKFPSTEEEWLKISNDFEKKWNFPNCLGAVDGKHVSITKPANSGSWYYNYKGRFSMVLMAVVNANYEFIMCDFGTNGRVSDGGVIENTEFYAKLNEGSLNIPAPRAPENSTENLPFVFVGDEAFMLRPDFMKPFNQRDLDKERRIFNYRLSRARRIVENAFGILANRFRIFHTDINLQVETTEKVVMTAILLHNFLRRNCQNAYTPVDRLDSENESLGEVTLGLRGDCETFFGLENGPNRNPSLEAKRVRQSFMYYFNNVCPLPWQERMISNY